MESWLDNKTLKQVQRVAVDHCANMTTGNKCVHCPLGESSCFYFRSLDEGQQVQRCRYFEEAVLPNDPALDAEYNKKLRDYLAEDKTASVRTVQTGKCDRCKRSFTKKSNSQKYCPSCRAAAAKESAKQCMREKRLKQRTV